MAPGGESKVFAVDLVAGYQDTWPDTFGKKLPFQVLLDGIGACIEKMNDHVETTAVEPQLDIKSAQKSCEEAGSTIKVMKDTAVSFQ